MSKVNYEVRIGEYNDRVYLSIDMRVAAGLSKEDYETLRTSLQKIEDIAYHYKEIRGDETEEA